jgi:asparagine synthase (glutamine-hydrolysing)
MWAFCVYDKAKQQIILCRDRYGIKPLFYTVQDGKLIFSSMISAILAAGVQTFANDKAIMQFLAYNLEHHTGETFFNNVFSLEPGIFSNII